jgi:acetate CoA/acetoacetate CoA-transferase alpha subunit
MHSVSLTDAVAMIPDGASLMIGGFMGVGTPERLIDELVHQGKRNLTIIANDNAMPGRGIGKLVDAGLVASTVASHIGLNPETQKQMIAGKIKVELVPQGTLVERIRAGGAGLGGVLTPTGVGTIVEEGKQRIEVSGKAYLLETALRADFALLGAFLADYSGNLKWRPPRKQSFARSSARFSLRRQAVLPSPHDGSTAGPCDRSRTPDPMRL